VTSPARARAIGMLFVKIALTVAVLLAVTWTFDFRAALRLLSSVTWVTIAACVAIQLCQSWIAGVRLSEVVSLFGTRLSVGLSARITLESMFFNQAFISFIGGDAFRVWRLRNARVPIIDATSAIVLDRIVGVMGNHLVFVALLPLVFGHIASATIQYGLVLLAAGGIGGIALVLALGLLGRQGRLLRLLPMQWRESRIFLVLVDLTTVGRHILDNPRVTWRIFLMSALLAVMNCLLFFLILRNWDIPTELSLFCAAMVPGVMEIALAPVSVGGWGLREGVAVVGFGAVGLNSEFGLAASAAYGISGLAVGLLGGAAWLLERSSQRSVSEQLGVADKAPPT
jgi:uncharacterized membrane protein YbhN (UPF0104 family)